VKLAKCKVYASTNAYVTLDNATYIGETLFTIPEIFNITSFLSLVGTGASSGSDKRIMQNGQPNSHYNQINAVAELSSAAFRIQYNSGGDMRGINMVRNAFSTFVISTSTSYGRLYFDFGGDYYIRESNNGGSALISKETGAVIQAYPTGISVVLGGYQYNTSYNNIAFATVFYYDGKLVPCGFNIDRYSSTISFLCMSRSNLASPYLPDSISQYILNSYSPDPYADIPESGPSTPSGTYDFSSSDDISFPALPQLSAVSTGFISLWSPSEEQMLKLSSFMWNADPLTIDFWKKIVADPMKLIYGLNIIPLDLEEMGLIDGEGTVVVGLIDTGVLMNHLSAQWVELDCGSITLDETWSAYLDYDPYTKLEVYLPYCGTHPLKVDDFMPGTISLKYHIDLLSGACVAILVSTKSDKHGDTLNSVVYQFMGNCASQLPVTSEQYADAVRSVIQLAASIGTMVALGAGGAGAGAAVASTAMPTAWGHFDSPLHTTSALSTQVAGLVPAEDMGPIDWRGYMPPAGTPSLAETTSKAGGTLKKIGGIHAASAAVENVMGIKPNIERSGAIGSTGGLLSVQTPYLILTRPRQARPKDQNKYTGYPSFITETLGDLEGWTIVQAIHLENIACTAEELAEIDELLKSGVIF